MLIIRFFRKYGANTGIGPNTGIIRANPSGVFDVQTAQIQISQDTAWLYMEMQKTVNSELRLTLLKSFVKLKFVVANARPSALQ